MKLRNWFAFLLAVLPGALVSAAAGQSIPMGMLPVSGSASDPVPQCFALGQNAPVTTAPMATSGAGVIVVNVSWYGSSAYHVTVSDNLGNGAPAELPAYGSDVLISTFYYLSPTVGPSHTFTIGFSGSTYYATACITPLTGVSALDIGSINGSDAGFSTTCGPGPIDLSSGIHKVITAFDVGTNTSPAISSPFTLAGYIPGASGVYDGIALATAALGAGRINPQWTSNANYRSSCSIVSFH